MLKRFSLICILIFLGTVVAQTGIPRAQAMFIYNFSRLIEWPSSYKNGPFVIGILGSSSTQIELSNYTKGKKVGAQPITIRKFKKPEEVSTCHILFVPFAKTKFIPDVLARLGNKSVLIISERNGAINEGATINFVIVNNSLKFELKSSNATKNNIKLSSKLKDMAYKNY